MTTHKNRTSLVAASAAALLSVALLAGCSGASVDDFCEDQKALEDLMPTGESDDMSAVADELGDKIDAIEPPSEIEDDWKVLKEGSLAMTDAMASGDTAEMGKISEEVLTDEYMEASERVDAFTQENCEA